MIGIGVGLINVLIWGGLFGVTGIGLLVYGWNLNRKAGSTPNWPAVKGKVVSAQVNRTAQATGMPGYSPVTFVPVIEYSYQVEGSTYQGNNFASSGRYNSVTAQNIVDRYPAGKDITVRYNPSDPRQAVIEVSAANGNFYMMAGEVALVLGLILSCVILGFSIFTSGSLNGLTGFLLRFTFARV